jgi:hypothetical protein
VEPIQLHLIHSVAPPTRFQLSPNGGGTLAELLRWWKGKPSTYGMSLAVPKHHLSAPSRLAQIRPVEVEQFLAEKETEGLGPQIENRKTSVISLSSTERRTGFEPATPSLENPSPRFKQTRRGLASG